MCGAPYFWRKPETNPYFTKELIIILCAWLNQLLYGAHYLLKTREQISKKKN